MSNTISSSASTSVNSSLAATVLIPEERLKLLYEEVKNFKDELEKEKTKIDQESSRK